MDKSHTNTALRTPETWARYQNAPKRRDGSCFMCDLDGIVIIKEYQHWVIIENQYPYDTVAEVHHLLVPREHEPRADELSVHCIDESSDIMSELEKEGYYDCIISNFPVGQSQKQHFHAHLIKWKRV